MERNDNLLNVYKNIRIFISSTFNDLCEERDAIIKKCIPQFEIEAKKRGCRVFFVDLRLRLILSVKKRRSTRHGTMSSGGVDEVMIQEFEKESVKILVV